MLLHSRTSHPVGVSSSLSIFLAHAVVSCLCAVGSAHTCRLLPSLSQLILLASDQRLLSEWIRLLISHFPLLIAIFHYSVVTCLHSQILFFAWRQIFPPAANFFTSAVSCSRDFVLVCLTIAADFSASQLWFCFLSESKFPHPSITCHVSADNNGHLESNFSRKTRQGPIAR